LTPPTFSGILPQKTGLTFVNPFVQEGANEPSGQIDPISPDLSGEAQSSAKMLIKYLFWTALVPYLFVELLNLK
jgi:hypothetical protein